MNDKWRGILKIFEIQHISSDNKVIESYKNIYNVLHTEGEYFILSKVFTGESIPDFFYFGLDNRTNLFPNQEMSSIQDEPSAGTGYIRQSIASVGQFTIESVLDHYVARGPILIFSAIGGSWGPVRNLFLTDKIDNTGMLISSVRLPNPITLESGNSLNVRMGLGLKDCP